MKRTELEKYLNKSVVITFYDHNEINGVLQKTRRGHENPDYNFDKYYYLVGDEHNVVFRCSHVRKIREVV